MTSGYFRKPEATQAITLPGGWLDTGDLAFRLDGEVFVTGRVKDLIIKAGRNFIPQEIEEAASGVEGVRRGCVAAFGVVDEAQATERLIVVAESRRTGTVERDRIAGAITERVSAEIGVPPDEVVVVPPGAVLKTSSGKVRRAATRDLYERGRLGRPQGTTAAQRARLAAGWLAAQARAGVKGLARGTYATYLAGALGLLGLAIWPLALALPGRRAARRLERLASRAGLWLAGCRLSVEGGETLGDSAPILIVSNHTSYVDIPALLALIPRHFAFVAKHEVLRWPLVGHFVRRAGHITVDRASARAGVATAGSVALALEQGEAVLVFPEATFTAAAGLRPFRLGAFKTAVETGVPIVPIALSGARRVLRDGTRVPRPGPIHLWIGPRMTADGLEWRDIVALRDRVADAIAAHSGEPRLDLVAAGPVRP